MIRACHNTDFPMSNPATQTADTNWTGVSYGIVLGFVAAYFQFKVPPVLPVMFDLYGYETFVAGGFMSSFAVAGMLISVRIGQGIRQEGAKRYLFAAFALMLTGTAIGLIWPDSGSIMLVSRTIEGFGAAVLAVCMPAFANMSAGPKHLPIIIAAQATWIPVGQLVANIVAQPSVAAGFWQPVWWFGALAVVLIAIWTGFILARGSVPGIAHIPRPSANPAQTNQPASALAPMTKPENRALWLAAVLFFLWQAQFTAYFTWLTVYLVNVRGSSADGAVLTSQIPVVVLLIFALLGGVILKTGLGVIKLLTMALALQTLGWMMIPLAGYASIGLASLIVWGIAAGLTPTSLWALPSTLLGGHRAGTDAFAVVLTGRYLGILMGPLIAAAAFEITGNWDAVPYTFAVIALLTIVGTLIFGSQMRALHSRNA
jgi:predicted MFS family arabinose efflux permease